MIQLTFAYEEDAIEALRVINNVMGFPKTGKNAKSGKDDPNAQITTTWDEVRKAKDIDKWYFKKPDDIHLLQVSNYSEEEFNPAWNPNIED